MLKKFYVYALIDPRPRKHGAVFYIGKGTARKCLKDDRTRKHLRDVINGYHPNPRLAGKINAILKKGLEYGVEFLFSSDNELECLQKEREWIAFYGRKTLCNLTDGGEGLSGNTHTDEVRAKIKASHKLQVLNGGYTNAKYPLVCVDGILDSTAATAQRFGIRQRTFLRLIRLGYPPQEIVNRYRRSSGKSRWDSVFPESDARLVLVEVDGISDTLKNTCLRIGLDEQTMGKYISKGYTPQQVADRSRSRVTGASKKFALFHKERIIPRNNTTGFYGVGQCGNLYRARISVNGLRINLGTFSNALDAARAYNVTAKQNYGDYAQLNPVP